MSVCGAGEWGASQGLLRAVWPTSSLAGAGGPKRTLTMALQCILSKEVISRYPPPRSVR